MARRRLLDRWEALPARTQAVIAYPVVTALLIATHLVFFQRVSLGRSLGYSLFEGMIVTALVVVASQFEAARRRGGGDDNA